MTSYVNPKDVVNPDAEPLTEAQVKEWFHDSWRPQGVFIKSHVDPNFKRDEKGVIFDDAQGDRGFGVVTFHILKTPILQDNQKIIGYYKLRGPPSFPDENTAHEFGTNIFASHDSYSRMVATPFGVMQPIVTEELTPEEQAMLDEAYSKQIAAEKDKEDAFVVQARQAERIAREKSKEFTKGSIDDYVRQQLRLHAAKTCIEKAQKRIKDAQIVLENSTKKVTKMESRHPNYVTEGLVHYKKSMVAIGDREPQDFFDQNLPDVKETELPGFFL